MQGTQAQPTTHSPALEQAWVCNREQEWGQDEILQLTSPSIAEMNTF